jgi:outer membrane lipoprotein-sorting protein
MNYKSLFLFLGFVFIVAALATADPNPTELIRKADIQLRGEISSTHYAEFVIERPDKTLHRKIVVYLKGKEYSFSHITEPIAERDTTILKRNYDLWMYTPKAHKNIRIPPAMMHEGVFDSDFTYDDLAKEATLADDYSHTLVGLSKAMLEEYGEVYVIDLSPLPGRPIAYKKLRAWVRSEGTRLLRLQYYNEELQVTRVLEFYDFKQMGDRTISTSWKMVNLQKKGYITYYKILKANYNDITSDDMFAIRSLENPPAPLWEETHATEPARVQAVEDPIDKTPADQYPHAGELVRKADILLRGEISSNHYTNFIISRPGMVSERKMIVYLKGKKYSLAHVTEPIRDRDTVFLKRDYDLWTYTPVVRKNIRIPVTMMHEGVFGSDFTYDDLIKEASLADDYTHTIIGISKSLEKVHGKVYVIDSLPLPDRPIAYRKLRLWIRESPFPMIIRQQFYSEKLEVVRVLDYSEVRQVGNRTLPTKWEMVNLTQNGYSTLYQIINASYNDIADEEMFALRSLENPPSPAWEKK